MAFGTGSIKKVLIAIVVLIVIILIIYLMFVAVRAGLNMFSKNPSDSGMGVNNIINDITNQIKTMPDTIKSATGSIRSSLQSFTS